MASSEEIRKTKNHYERRIKTFLATGDDADAVSNAVTSVGAEPLELWWRYILWAQKQGTPKFVEDLCKRCVECFTEKPALMRDVDAESDERFAKIWLKIAANNTPTDDPAAIYKHMYRSKIATKLSLFYVNWATHSYQTDNREFAVKILNSALKKNVEPRQSLLDLLAKWTPNESADASATQASTTNQQKQQQQRSPSDESSVNSHHTSIKPTPTGPASAIGANSIAKYRKAEVYPHGDVDVAPNGWEQSLEEIRFGRWRRERERAASEHSVRVSELEKSLAIAKEKCADAVAKWREAEAREEKERKEKERLKSNVAELEKTMASHVEELVKDFEAQLAAKDEEISKLTTKLTVVEDELATAMSVAAATTAEAKKAVVTEKRDHASAMLTPKGPAAKRQSYGFGATVMPSPTINSKMAQAQVLALFNQTMKFGTSEPSISGADPSTLNVDDDRLPATKPAISGQAPPAFQIFQDDGNDDDKENADRPAPAFAIFKDPTEKINVPKNIAGGQPKLAGILKSSAPPTVPAVFIDKTGENNFDPMGVEHRSKKSLALKQQPQQQPQHLQMPGVMADEDNFGDITSFNPPESSTVNVASILKAQGVKSARQLYNNNNQQEPTVKFSVPTKQLRKFSEAMEMEEDDDGGAAIDPFGGVTEFIPPSCSTSNWQALAKVAQRNLDMSSGVVLSNSSENKRVEQLSQQHNAQQKQPQQQQQQPQNHPSNQQQPPPPPPPISQGLLDVVADDDAENPHDNPRPMSPIYEVSKEFSQISVGSNRTRCSSSSSSSSSSSASTSHALSKSSGVGLLSSHHHSTKSRFMENLQEEDEEEEAHRRSLRQPPVSEGLPTPGGLGRLKTDGNKTMNASERSHAMLPPTTPGGPAAPPRVVLPGVVDMPASCGGFQPFVDEPSLPSTSMGMRSELPLLPMDDLLPTTGDDMLPDVNPMDDLDELMRREREEEDVDNFEDEEERREVPRNDLSCLFDSPALMPTLEESDRQHHHAGDDGETTSDVTGSGGGFDPLMETHARDYDAATFNLNQTVAIEDKVPEHECTIMIDPEDPWKPKLIQSFLRKAAVPLPQRRGYVELSPDKAVAVLKIGKTYDFGVDGSFLIQKQIGEGGFGRIFLADWTINDGNRRPVCLKFQKPPCPWEFYVSSEIHRRLESSLVSSSSSSSSSAGNERRDFMWIERAYFSDTSSIFVNDIGKGTLLDVVNAFKTHGTPMGEDLALLLSLEMLTAVDRLHSCHIIHADVKPDNFLFCGPLPDPAALKAELTSGGGSAGNRRPFGEKLPSSSASSVGRHSLVKLIDFGRCIDMTLFREGTNFLAKVKTDGYQCQEMIEGKPWTYQIDLFGLLATIFVLLRGEYPRWKRQALGKAIFPSFAIGSGCLRSYVHRELWNEFVTTLVGIPDCDSVPPLTPLIRKVKDALTKCLDGYERKFMSYSEVLRKAHLV